jgi:hypothetical protein
MQWEKRDAHGDGNCSTARTQQLQQNAARRRVLLHTRNTLLAYGIMYSNETAFPLQSGPATSLVC